ncbi:hypothetical protein N7508_006777 [Penicillium antarcticum]|uniref:uncharacterized protein n=1 Tax=Penicillium antarcticum TaxID=416450 RepID=UPI0023914766|nr:uncharacterized protein N7508_006777 [Penicillium antarcticum]KAJ5301914.1 hypothetical protein N7508_006777 [Penicillium antarcticum]
MVLYLDYVTLDVFTSSAFKGNPLAVVFLPRLSSERVTRDQMQAIAREFNFSETIFVYPVSPMTPSKRRIDIFMTTKELPFAGHPTIGAASWLLRLSPCREEQAELKALTTKAGDIPISQMAASSLVSASIPHEFHLHKTRFPLSELLRLHPTLGQFLQTNEFEKDSFPVFSVVKGMTVIPVELPSINALGAIDMPTGGETIKTLSALNGGYLDAGWDGEGLINLYFYVRDVPDGGKTVLRTRMLLGNFEDPATGSSATGLAAYLSLFSQQPADNLVFDYEIVQGVEMGRKSNIGVHVVLCRDKKGIEEVKLIGGAVQVFSGQIRLD